MASVEYPETGHDWCAAVEDDSWWFAHRNRFLREVMRRFPPDTPLYDVGGGNGVVAAALRDNGIRTIVVEPGAAGARRARERGLESINATLEGAGLSPASVGSVGLFDVLEHIDDADGFLRRIFDQLRPGGRLYVTVPAYQALWSAEDEYAHHFRRYTAGSLNRALRRAGFTVELATYMFALLPLPIFFFRSLPYRLGHARPFSAEAVRQDHRAGGGGVGAAALHALLAAELSSLRFFGRLPFGGSVVAVGRKQEVPKSRSEG
jgi:SAM-dependent methyltransferase